MGIAETNIQNQIRVETSKLGARLFRNNVFQGYVGKPILCCRKAMMAVEPGDILLKKARVIKSGFPVGSSDLIGYTPTIINDYMVGQRVAVFTAIEVKTPRGIPTEKQINFVNAVTESGGIGLITHSLTNAVDIIRNPRGFLNK